VVRSCFEALRQLPALDSDKTSLSDLSGKIQNILAILKTVGCEEEIRTFSSLELSGLVCKLSEDLRDKWNAQIKEKQSLLPLPNLGEFAIWIEERAAESTWRR
jgi:hypothetical protein